MPPQPVVSNIQGLLDRMTNVDKDFRFMATNDLMAELQRENICWDDDNETKVTHQILRLLCDKNGEVQNLAVKCLGSLVTKIKDDRRQYVIKYLCQMLNDSSDQVRDIASISLKTIVSEVPITKRIIEIVREDLNPHLIIAISNSADVGLQLESLDILTELVNRVGSQLEGDHEKIQLALLKQLASDRSAVRKRSMTALSLLLDCCSENLFTVTVNQLLESLIEVSPKPEENSEAQFYSNTPRCVQSKTLLQCLATITRTAGHRTKAEQLEQILPVISTFCQINDDELREYCLQAFEAYVKRCAVNINKFVPDIVQVCLNNISHDPNYNYDEEEVGNDMDTDDNNQDEDESDSADDYSDDDDMSWKVRRASAKCLEAIILTRKDLVNGFVLTVAPILVNRFKEREESIKGDILQAFVSLLKQIRTIINDPKVSHNQLPVSKLNEMVPSIVLKSAHLMRERSIKTRQCVFQMYTEIVNCVPNAFVDQIPITISGVLFSLTDKNATSNLKLDTLLFMGELIDTHEAATFYPHIDTILPAILTAADDSFYKISAEAIALLSKLVTVLRPPNQLPMSNYENALTAIYTKTVERMASPGQDLEIKDRAITCIGQIVATFGDKMENELPVALNLLHERLGNDRTRLTCAKSLIKIANSPLNISLDSIFPAAFTTLASFLRKTSRPLIISTLVLIEKIVQRSPDLLRTEEAQSVILIEVPHLINENDLYVAQLALAMLTTIIKTQPTIHKIIPQQIIPQTLQLISSPLLQGLALQALLRFFSTVVQTNIPGLDHKSLYSSLTRPIFKQNAQEPVHKQAYCSTAKAISAISAHDNSLALKTASQLIGDYKQNKDHDNLYTLVLLSLGEIGRVKNLQSVQHLTDVILHAFNSSSEEVKSAGSYALGCVAVGNMKAFLPIILHEIEARNKRQYLILHSLREVISGGHLPNIEPVWNLLMKHCECQEEGTRNVVSECLGKLTLVNPTVLLQRLTQHLKSDYVDKPLARATIVAAIKFTISDQPQEIDDLLRSCIGDFLLALKDDDINVRRVALITLNSAAHNKPSLITQLLPTVLPLLYEETQVRSELIRHVEMGPFKHRVDDGLDTRKAAFECMYTLLDTCQDELDIFQFLAHVEMGLIDHYDIKMLTYLMLNKLVSLCPGAVMQRIEVLVKLIREVCTTNPKPTAVKQEFEKQDELKRTALRTFDAIRSIPDANRHITVVRLIEDTIQGSKELSALYATIHRDTSVSNIASENTPKSDLAE